MLQELERFNYHCKYTRAAFYCSLATHNKEFEELTNRVFHSEYAPEQLRKEYHQAIVNKNVLRQYMCKTIKYCAWLKKDANAFLKDHGSALDAFVFR